MIQMPRASAESLATRLSKEIRNALMYDTEARQMGLFGQFFRQSRDGPVMSRWEKSADFIRLVQILYTHAFVTSKHDYHDENLLCKAKGFHNQQGYNSSTSSWCSHYLHRGIMAPSHGASVSLIAAQTAGLLMSHSGPKNPFGWSMPASQPQAETDARTDFVVDYTACKTEQDQLAIATSLWGAANIQKLTGNSYSASFFTGILESSVKRCLLPEGWRPGMMDTDIVLTLGKNIVEVEDITPPKLLVWAHLLHQISCGFAESMRSKLYAHSKHTEDEWGMLSIKYLIVLWIGFIQSNLVRIGHGHNADYTDGSNDDGKVIGVIFRNKLEVLKGAHKGTTILHLGDNCVQDISKVIGRKVYEWSTIKNSLDQKHSPSVNFAIGRPVDSFSKYNATMNVPISNLSFDNIVAKLICPVNTNKRSYWDIFSPFASRTSTASIPLIPTTTDTTTDTDDTTTETTTTDTTTSVHSGSGFDFDVTTDDDHSSISSRSRTLSDVYCESDDRSSLNNARYMTDKNGNVYKLVPELTNRNVKVYSRKAERMPARESGGPDHGIDGISMISLSSGSCVTISDCNDEFCAVIWQCTTNESSYKLYDDFEKIEARLWGRYYSTKQHPFCDHLPNEFHDRVIRKLLIVTTVPDQETKSTMLHPKNRRQFYLKQFDENLPYKLKGLTLTARDHPWLSNDCTVDHMFFTADQSECCDTKMNMMKRGHELATWQDEVSAVLGAVPHNPARDVKSIAEFSRQSKRTKTDTSTNGTSTNGTSTNGASTNGTSTNGASTNQTAGFIFEGYVLGIVNGLMPEFVVQKAIDRPSDGR